MKVFDKESFCVAPWTSIYSNGTSNGPCCVNYKLSYSKNINEYLNSEELNTLKNNFLNGIKSESCKKCWDAEKLGLTSIRLSNNKSDLQFARDYCYFTIRLSNKCNFTCRMCHPKYSSAWELDKKASSLKDKSPDIDFFILENFYKTVDYVIDKARKNIITVTLIGGEPLISDELLYFFEKCEKEKVINNIKLIINTNLSVTSYKNIEIKNFFDKFKKVSLYVSLDGINKVGEYIRRGFKQKIFDKNVNHYYDYIKSFSVTIQIYNIYDIPNIYKYSAVKNIPISLGFISKPEYLSLKLLDKEERENIINSYINNNFTDSTIINMLKYEEYDGNLNNFITYTDNLDKLWKTNFIKEIPDLKNWYERVKNE